LCGGGRQLQVVRGVESHQPRRAPAAVSLGLLRAISELKLAELASAIWGVGILVQESKDYDDGGGGGNNNNDDNNVRQLEASSLGKSVIAGKGKGRARRSAQVVASVRAQIGKAADSRMSCAFSVKHQAIFFSVAVEATF
jgi:hypothetical protein